MFHIHWPFRTLSFNLLSPQINTHTRLQAHIDICKSSCVLCCVPCSKQPQRPADVIRWGESEKVSGAQWPDQLCFLACCFIFIFYFFRFLIQLLRMSSSCTPARTPQESKQELEQFVQLHDFALSLGGFVGLSGGICGKPQANPGVKVDIKSQKQKRMKGKCHGTCRSLLSDLGCLDFK